MPLSSQPRETTHRQSPEGWRRGSHTGGSHTGGTDTDVSLLAEASETARPRERSSGVERMDKHSFPDTKHQAVGISKMDNHRLHGT